MRFGPWLERLECIAAGRELVATGGWRDIAGTPQTAGRAHVIPVTRSFTFAMALPSQL